MSVITRNYKEPPLCEKEMLRYAGCKSSDEELLQLCNACIDEVQKKLTYKVCYRELSVTIADGICDFGCFTVHSQNLAKNLRGCKTVILFGATLGVEIDRLIAKYGRISPSKALMMQAIGAERIEALCDAFCEDIAQEKNRVLKPRFSPGYGDLPLEVQKDIFRILDCSKQIGLSLNDSLLMSPSKSVTAFVGLVEETNSMEISNAMEVTGIIEASSAMEVTSFIEPTDTIKRPNATETAGGTKKINKCAVCSKTDCEYRGVV